MEGSLDGLGIIGQKRAAAANADRVAEENLEDTRNEIKRRVANLVTERGIQNNIISSYEQSMTEEMEETRKSIIRQFDAGRKSWIDVLNFQQELTI